MYAIPIEERDSLSIPPYVGSIHHGKVRSPDLSPTFSASGSRPLGWLLADLLPLVFPLTCRRPDPTNPPDLYPSHIPMRPGCVGPFQPFKYQQCDALLCGLGKPRFPLPYTAIIRSSYVFGRGSRDEGLVRWLDLPSRTRSGALTMITYVYAIHRLIMVSLWIP